MTDDDGLFGPGSVTWTVHADPVFPIGGIVKRGTKRPLSPQEVAAYDAPFPTRASKAAARVYPGLVPFAGNPAVPDQQRAWQVFERWENPFLCCFADGDPITRGGDAMWLERVPGTRGMAHRTLRGGHFIQEDDPAGFAAAIAREDAARDARLKLFSVSSIPNAIQSWRRSAPAILSIILPAGERSLNSARVIRRDLIRSARKTSACSTAKAES